MEGKLLVVEHKDLAGRILTVPQEVSEDGKLVLDEKGQATLPPKAAHFLCTVPGFSIVGESKKKEGPAKGEQEKTDQEQEAEDEGEIKQKYPNGDPDPNWKKEELAAWLEEKMIEFKPKDGKEVLLGKAFKYLENTNSIDEPQKERG